MSPVKLERQLAWRRKALLGGWLVAGAVLVGRSAQLQVLEGDEWRARAEGQHRKSTAIPAPRGAILDRDGVPLAISRETFKVSIDPQHVVDRAAMRALLESELGLSRSASARVTDPDREWAVVPGVYEPSVRQALVGVKGIYLERELRRDYPHGDLALGILGRMMEGEGRGGIEQAFDTVLRGRPGREVLARDGNGREIPGEVFEVEPPVVGGDVTLTIDLDLQDIAQQALREAVENTRAQGGDLLVTDPRSGEILAMVSMKDGRSDALSAINTPYEPGSTLKPFTVAAVLKNGRGRLSDSVRVGNGTWTVNGRTLHDVHSSGTMTLADALRVSSNVGIAKAAAALTPREQYENLRDFGFGIESGLPLPGEVGGVLRHPRAWSRQSPQSLAIGYEVSVTPVQMAMAYGALANGGRLMEARLVREVRPAGGTSQRPEPQVIREVVAGSLAGRIGEVLMDVVEDGTGTAAQLETFRVAGKSGTARAYAAQGGYLAGRYYASFVGYFPADDPQLVILVKLDSPRGSYYGGATAAPVTRATMEAALAARRTPLDRRALLRSVRAPAPVPAAGDVAPVRFASLEERWRTASWESPGVEPTTVPEPTTVGDRTTFDGPHGVTPVPVPDVSGLPARVAIRRLHALGLRVVWDESGTIRGTRPGSGARVAPGDTVWLRGGRSDR